MTVPRLHVLTDVPATHHAAFSRVLDTLAGDEHAALHLRDRHATGLELWTRAVDAIGRGVRVVINDRADVAAAAGAHGVHLPSQGLPTNGVRAMVSGGTLIGRSAHSAADADAGLAEGADYVFLGPVWPTNTHPGQTGIGLGAFAALARSPVVAIGGVTQTNAGQCLQAGAHGIAVIGAVWTAADPAAAVNTLRLLLER